MKRLERTAVVKEKFCVACGSCIKVCPRKAITVLNGTYAVVKTDQCVGCGLCAKECPASVISILERGEVNEA